VAPEGLRYPTTYIVGRFGTFQSYSSKKTGVYEPIGTHGDALENRYGLTLVHSSNLGIEP
jgi:hypothetical protein